jgi:Cys-tRNA(Pro)/Cys-tRNA(Cys) deacylase
MTPAVNELKKNKISHTLHHYDHDPKHPSYGLEAAEKLGVDPGRVFKTLVLQLDDGRLAVAVLPVSLKLNLKKAAAACGSKKAEMAPKGLVEKSTGYILGGVSPLGQKKRLLTVINSSAAIYPTILVSGGRRGLEIDLSPADLARLTGGRLHDLV